MGLDSRAGDRARHTKSNCQTVETTAMCRICRAVAIWQRTNCDHRKRPASSLNRCARGTRRCLCGLGADYRWQHGRGIAPADGPGDRGNREGRRLARCKTYPSDRRTAGGESRRAGWHAPEGVGARRAGGCRTGPGHRLANRVRSLALVPRSRRSQWNAIELKALLRDVFRAPRAIGRRIDGMAQVLGTAVQVRQCPPEEGDTHREAAQQVR